MKTRITFVIAVAALTLAGCSAPQEASESASATTAAPTTEAAAEATATAAEESNNNIPEPMPQGTFELITDEGTKFTFDLPTPASDPRVADIEAFRKKAEAAPVSYIVADVDNRQGEDSVNMYSVSVFDPDGKKYEFGSATEFVEDAEPIYTIDYEYKLPSGKKLPEKTGEALLSQGNDLLTDLSTGVDRSERGTLILVSSETDLPEAITRVAVEPSGMGNEADAWVQGKRPVNPYEALEHLQGKTMDECFDVYADIAESNGQPRDGVKKEPGIKESCEMLISTDYDEFTGE